MKIAHYPASFLPVIGGAELIVHNLAESQSRKGHDVHVFGNRKTLSYFNNNNIKPTYRLIAVPRYIYILNKFFPPESLVFNYLIGVLIKKYQSKYDFDIWHMNLISEYSIAILQKLNRLNVPCIGTFRGSDIQILPEVNYGRRLNSSFDNLIKKNIKKFDHLTAISNTVKDEYLKLSCSQKKISSIPNFISKKHFALKKYDRNSVLLKNNLPQNKKIIITIGRNHPKKGYNKIPIIVKRLLENEKDFIWIVVGKNCEELIIQSKDLKVDSHIIVINEISKDEKSQNRLKLPSNTIIELYKCADIFCFPTLMETFGNIFLEAMATECPIVTTNAPGAKDLVKHNYNGLISEVNDADGIANNILLLMNNNNLRKKVINGGILTLNRFDKDKIVNQYLELYSNTIKEKNI